MQLVTVMRTFITACRWIFGLLMLAVGVGNLFQSIICIPFLLIALMLIPPTGVLIDEKIPLSYGKKIGLVFTFMMIATLYDSYRKEEVEQQEKLLKQAQEETDNQQKNINFFKANRSSILADVRQSIKRKKYAEAVALSSKYLAANDKELSTLNNTANAELVAIAKSNEVVANKKILQNNQQTIQLNGKWRCGNDDARFTIKDKYWRYDSTVITNGLRFITVTEGYLTAPDVITTGSLVTFASESESMCAPEMAEQMGSPDGCTDYDPNEVWQTWVITKYSGRKLYIDYILRPVDYPDRKPRQLVCSKI